MLSVSKIQAFLGVSGRDVYLQQLEASATADIERLTGWYLGASKAFVDVRDIAVRRYGLTDRERQDWQSIRLSQPAAISAITLSERNSADQDWIELAKTSSGRDVFEKRGARIHRVIGSWPEGLSTVKAAYSWGFAADSAPAAFLAVGLDLIAERYTPVELMQLGGNVASASMRGADLTLRQGGGSAISKDLERRILRLRSAEVFS